MGFQILTNRRAPKAENQGNYLFVRSTSGQLAVSEVAANALGLKSGDYVSIADNNGKKFLFKGHAEGTLENGKKVPQIGSKLAAQKKGIGGQLNFSSEMAYAALEGKTDKVQTYLIGGLEEGQENDRVSETDPDTGVTYTFHPITFQGERNKMERSKKETEETTA